MCVKILPAPGVQYVVDEGECCLFIGDWERVWYYLCVWVFVAELIYHRSIGVV